MRHHQGWVYTLRYFSERSIPRFNDYSGHLYAAAIGALAMLTVVVMVGKLT